MAPAGRSTIKDRPAILPKVRWQDNRTSVATIAITGITGLAGGSVGRVLQRAGHRIVGISRQNDVSIDGAEMRTVNDLRNSDALMAVLEGCDTILHFADRADRKTYAESDVDTAGLIMIALRTACDQLGIHRIVAASSVYAERDDRASDRYVRSKRRMEACALAPTPGAQAVVLRLPPLHGQGARGTIRHIANAAQRGWPLPFGLARASRRFLSLKALGDLCVAIATLDDERFAKGAGSILYPSSPSETSLAELAISLGKGNARLVPVPGIDHLVSGVIPAAQLADERNELYRVIGWREMP